MASYSNVSSCGYFLLLHNLLLLLRKCTEEFYLLFIGRSPLIVGLESAAQMCLYFDVEGLWFDHSVGSVINTWDSFCRTQMVQIACEFSKLLPCSCLLSLLLFETEILSVVVELLAHFFILIKLFSIKRIYRKIKKKHNKT